MPQSPKFLCTVSHAIKNYIGRVKCRVRGHRITPVHNARISSEVSILEDLFIPSLVTPSDVERANTSIPLAEEHEIQDPSRSLATGIEIEMQRISGIGGEEQTITERHAISEGDEMVPQATRTAGETRETLPTANPDLTRPLRDIPVEDMMREIVSRYAPAICSPPPLPVPESLPSDQRPPAVAPYPNSVSTVNSGNVSHSNISNTYNIYDMRWPEAENMGRRR